MPLFCGLVAVLLVYLFLNHLAFFLYSVFRISLRKALIGLLYHKVLKLTHHSVASGTVGKLIGLSSADLNNVERATG